MKYKEFIVALAIQSKKSKVPTDFRFETTKIMLDLNKVIWCKQYFHEATDKFNDDYTNVFIDGQNDEMTIQINYDDFKKILKNNKG
tara:strand:+ start:15035 stop:15292 length:258 start_codon:yes stop_codon:yes gene_type:complete